MQSMLPSPAVSIVGRHNSGKTTLVVKLIEELVARGMDVGSIKHHSHKGFDIDIPGKDSYRHHHAGTSETIIAAPGQMALVKDVEGELECSELVKMMPGHDIVIVEGYRKSGLPAIEIMRSGNAADAQVAEAFASASLDGTPLGADFVQLSRPPHTDGAGASSDTPVDPQAAPYATDAPLDSQSADLQADPLTANAPVPQVTPASGTSGDQPAALPTHIAEKMPTQSTVAVVTDIPLAQEAAGRYGIPAFDLDDVSAIADFLATHFARQRLTVVIQAGGESRRMGQSKATVPFLGRPLIMRLVERLLPIADELVITTNEGSRLEFLHDEYPTANIRLVPDELDYRGALPGLLTALTAATYEYVATVACDMIFASPNLIAAECAQMSLTGADAVIPVNQHGYEPFHALYNRDACLPHVRSWLDKGDKRAQSFLDDINVCEMPHEMVLRAEPMGGCFINANTPHELASIEENFFKE